MMKARSFRKCEATAGKCEHIVGFATAIDICGIEAIIACSDLEALAKVFKSIKFTPLRPEITQKIAVCQEKYLDVQE